MEKEYIKQKYNFITISIFILFLILMYKLAREDEFLHVISDISFVIGMIFFLVGFSRIVSNSGFFNSTKYGMKKIASIIKKDELKMDYLDYLLGVRKNSNKKQYKQKLFIGAILLSFSLIAALV